MTTTTSYRWTRVLDGWYSLNLRSRTGITHMEVMRTDLGLWKVQVNGEDLGMTDKLATAKRVALAAV